MIELAARAWKLDSLQTIRKLESLGIEFAAGQTSSEGFSDYKRSIGDVQRRLRGLQADSRRLMANNRSMAGALCNKLGLNSELIGSIWAQRMGAFIGAADTVCATRAFWPFVKTKRDIKTGPGHIFRGSGWKNVLTIPFHDLPGRVCGYMFVGRNAETDDMIYRPISQPDMLYRARHKTLEAGLCMYDVIHGEIALPRTFKHNIFVVDNPLVALQIQNRHMREANLPLPITGSYHGIVRFGPQQRARGVVTESVWDSLPDKQFIFWGQTPNAAVFNMASHADGRVYIAKTRSEFHRQDGQRWLEYIQKTAKPWMVALERAINYLQGPNLEALLSELDIPPSLFQEFMRTCNVDARERIESTLGSPTLAAAFVNNKPVSQTPDGWFDDKTGQRISDGTLRIDHALYNEDDDQCYYQGVLRFHGDEIPFCCNAKEVENSTFAWMKKRLIKAGHGVMTYSASWSRHAIELATQFHTPEIRHGVGHFGWNSQNANFVLPKFVITSKGEVEEEAAFVIDEMAPCQSIAAPSSLETPDLIALTADTAISQIFWATTACLAANIIAPALNRHVAGIGLVGDGAMIIGRLTAREAGCSELSLSKQVQGITAAEIVQATLTRHSWPLIVVLPRGPQRSKLAGWLNQGAEPNIVLDADRYLADALGLQGNWRFITNNAPLLSAVAVSEHGAKVIPHWLQDFCQRSMVLRSNEDSLVLRVLDDMAAWLLQGDKTVIQQARYIIDDAPEAAFARASRLVATIYRYIDDGSMSITVDAFDGATPTSIVYIEETERSGVFIPRAGLNKLLNAKGIPLPDPVDITAVLAEAGALEDGNFEYNGGVGWLICRQWWDDQYANCRTQQTRLRIVGDY